MATMITSECINCGACEPECPNTAIYQGGVEWQAPDGATHAALSDEIFYIVPEKCTECVGFHDEEACAAVCPVDCCVPNPEIPETHEVLLARARALHPDESIPDDAPSRFKKEGGAAPAAAGAAAAARAPTAAPTPTPAAPAAPAAAPRRVEKKVSAPKPLPPKSFAGELPDDYEVIVNGLGAPRRRLGSALRTLPLLLLAAAQGIFGALPSRTLRPIEEAVSDSRFFRTDLAIAANVMLNLLVYPIVFAVVGLVLGQVGPVGLFDQGLRWWTVLGFLVGLGEAWWRLRECFRGAPIGEASVGPAVYGVAVLPLAVLVRAMVGARGSAGGVGVDGYYESDEPFDDKLERARRYGDVFKLEERDDAYLLRVEFPRRLPPNSLGDSLALPPEMPDYDFDVQLRPGAIEVHGKVVDPDVRKLTGVAPAFPSEFVRRVDLAEPVVGFRHRYRNKTLEVVLPKAMD
jgi:ferredoxin